MRQLRTSTCSVCGSEFQSRSKHRKFCDLKCYARSKEGRAKLLAASKKGAAQRRKHKGSKQVACIQCGQAIYTTTPEKTFRFCNSRCRRTYWRKLFDELIANPEGLPLPQNYDEFLDRAELPCLMPNCDWEGRSLGGHMFQCHGITANEFKEMAGFNRGTGLVGTQTARMIAKSHTGRRGGGFLDGVDQENTDVNHHPPLRLEGKEHLKKAQLGRKHSEETKKKMSESAKRAKRLSTAKDQ